MNTILILTVAGSCMMLFYLVCLHTIGGTVKGRRVWLTVTALFYLIPLWKLKEYYVWVLERIGGRGWYLESTYYNERNDFIRIQTEELVYRNEFFQLNTLIYIVWVTVAVALLIYNGVKFFVRRHRIMKYCVQDPEPVEVVERLKKSMGIRRKVRIYYLENMPPVTMGFWRPIILLPKRMQGNIPEAILKHELTHIKNGDVLTKVVLMAIVNIHWFNPIAYWMKREYEKIFEMLSDDGALNGLGDEERVQYAGMLIREMKAGRAASTWIHHFAWNANIIEERIENVMNKKKVGKVRKCVGSVALVAAMFVCSLTAFAYEDVNDFISDSEYLDRHVDLMADDKDFVTGETWFAMEDDVYPLSITDQVVLILFDEQFVDDEGNIYEVDSETEPYLNCNHSFHDGTLTQHYKYADGSCIVDYYHAQRCGLCGLVVVGDYINTISFAICPH